MKTETCKKSVLLSKYVLLIANLGAQIIKLFTVVIYEFS